MYPSQQQQQQQQFQHYLQQTKMPIPIRPRSSLSTTDDHRFKKLQSQKSSRIVLTLAGCCIFLLVLCMFLLGALVYVGKNSVHERSQKGSTRILSIYGNESFFTDQQLTTKPIKRFRPLSTSVEAATIKPLLPSSLNLFETPSLSPSIMTTSKVLTHLSYRLPKELKPYHYNLKLHPDLKNKTFTGNVNIKLEVLKPIAFIPVHAKNLEVTTESVWKLDKLDAPLQNITPTLTYMYPDHEYWVTEFNNTLEAGNYSLQLAFKGSLIDKIVGLYQSSYWNETMKEKRWIATSKFEPTYARQAFPCFDEPNKKAKFNVTILRPSGEGYHALSNMNVKGEKVLDNGLIEVIFAESVPMSTYLACFIVSDFAYQAKRVKGVLSGAPDFEMRVFSTVSQVNKVEYALNVGAAITEFYIDYFNVSYPLPKLDMAAIPDFVSGAMEHWGLVTYRETALLYDKTISSSLNKQRVATVVAHELAHMWFGNLVTMKWWNDLWLNEGFANYIEYKGVHHAHPEWDMLNQFIIDDLHSVMGLDATLASHPIVQAVENPDQITELFDAITYSKGASIIRMLEDLVGPEKFRNATTNYLNRFIYSNAETNDFLNEIEGLVNDFDVKLIMQTWTVQSGYPVVTVTRDGNTYKLSQNRFFANSEDYKCTPDDSQFNYHWSIPITYFTDQDLQVQRIMFNYNDNEVRVITPLNVNWIKFNKDQVGYYRVNYPADMWEALTTALTQSSHNFSTGDRAHLIGDAFALADANQLDYGIALNLSKYLINEMDYIPWSVGVNCLSHIKNVLYYTEGYANFTAYARRLLDNAYKMVTWTVGENHLQKVTVLNAACAFGHNEALVEAHKRFVLWLRNPEERPHPDVRSTVYYYGMQEAGNEQMWNQVWELFIREQDAQEKLKLMKSLAGIKQPWLLQRYITLAWNENHVRSQDYFTCLQYIAKNRIGESLVWDYVRENWPSLIQRFGLNDRTFGRMIPSITSHFATQAKLSDMEAFFEKYPKAGAGTTARKQAIENVKNNINWLKQHSKGIIQWLEIHTSLKETTATTILPNIV